MPDAYEYLPKPRELSFESAVAQLRERFSEHRVEPCWLPFADQALTDEIEAGLRGQGLAVEPFEGRPDELELFERRAEYSTRYAGYSGSNQREKRLEHFVATRLLELGPKSVFIDVAAASSPLPEITRRVFGCRSFAQDIMYAPGVRAHEIGGDACAMPVEAGFADAAALTCSLEHFEGDADIRLFTELARVLRPGGRIVVAPLYLNPFAAALTDPRFALAADDLRFDADAVIHCADGWGNRHGRFYSPETLQSRILRPHGDAFDFRVFRVGEPLAAGHTDHSVYLRFALLGVRR